MPDKAITYQISAKVVSTEIKEASNGSSYAQLKLQLADGKTETYRSFDATVIKHVNTGIVPGDNLKFTCSDKWSANSEAKFTNIHSVDGPATLAEPSVRPETGNQNAAPKPAFSVLDRPILSPGMDKYSAIANTFHDWNMNRRTALMQESENWRAGKIEESEIFPRATRAFNWLMGESGDDDSEFKEFHEELRKDKESVRLFLNFKFSQLEPQVVNDMLEGMYPETTYDNLSIKESLALLEAVEERVNS